MRGDADNLEKPILDALSKHIDNGDRQVERVWVQKVEPGRIFKFAGPLEVMPEALSGETPLRFTRLEDNLAGGIV